MNFIEQLLARLKATEGDVHAQAAVAAEFVLLSRPETDRQPLREALDAAAVLRWFDASMLARVLAIPEAEAAPRFEVLKSLPFVERYRRGERDLRNVHEATRLGWRKILATDAPDRFRSLSAQAAALFASDPTSAARIEWIYHLLCADPDGGANHLEKLDRDWSSTAHPEDRYALAAALQELDQCRMVHDHARAWVLLVIAWAAMAHGEVTQQSAVAREALDLARSAKDPRAEADSQCLVGDVLQAQGKLAEAQAAFGEYLRISRQLAEQDPSNAGWQRDLALAHSKVGDVLQAQGRLAEAQAAFGETLRISRRLAEQDPSNAGWQFDLGCSIDRMAGLLKGQGDLGAARVLFSEALQISRRLAAQDSSNANNQRDLAISAWRVASLDAEAGNHAAALPLYEEAARILGELVVRAPGFAQWAKDKEQVEAALQLCRLMMQVSKPSDAKPDRDSDVVPPPTQSSSTS
ncbi:MAG: tetratricopeptide repeat protein [Limisphaerales bacterium]